jgi:hypothetical protein
LGVPEFGHVASLLEQKAKRNPLENLFPNNREQVASSELVAAAR